MGKKQEIVFESIAKALRDFGFPKTTGAQVAEVFAAMSDGKDLPYGIVGMMAQKQIQEAQKRDLLPATPKESE